MEQMYFPRVDELEEVPGGWHNGLWMVWSDGHLGVKDVLGVLGLPFSCCSELWVWMPSLSILGRTLAEGSPRCQCWNMNYRLVLNSEGLQQPSEERIEWGETERCPLFRCSFLVILEECQFA